MQFVSHAGLASRMYHQHTIYSHSRGLLTPALPNPLTTKPRDPRPFETLSILPELSHPGKAEAN